MAHDISKGIVRLGTEDIRIPSDVLAQLWPLLDLLRKAVPAFGDVLRIALVLDASAVQCELRWRLAKRQQPSARTALHELIEAGVVVAFAPHWLDQEIRDHAAEIAGGTKAPTTAVLAEWDSFRRLIAFYPPAAVERARGPDVDDLPYLAAHSELAASGILTTDHHFLRTRVPVVALALVPELRTYARAAAVRVSVSVATMAVGAAAIGGAVLAVRAFLSLPGIVQVSLVAAAVVAAAHPTSRRVIADSLRKSGVALEIMGDAFAASSAAATAEQSALASLQSALPPPRRPTALAYARRACAKSGRPLSLAEIEAQMRSDGLQTRARDFTPYLRRIMRGSGQFVEVSAGRWALVAPLSGR
jgi:hypothetical protein